MPLKRTDRPNEKNAENSGVAVAVPESATKQKPVHTSGPFWETAQEVIFRLPLDNYDPAKVLAHVEYPDFVSIAYPRPDKLPELLCTADLCAAVNLRSAKGRFENGWLTITFRKIGGNLSPGHARAGHAMQWPTAEADRKPFPIPVDIVAPEPATIPAPQETDTRPMLDEAKSFIHEGERYYPLSLAAPAIQAARTTLVQWINKKTEFDGRPLQTYYLAAANRHFISEESITRAANRFIKWPSEEPVGPVTLGETRDQSGYIGLTAAAKTLRVDHHTIWRWITKGTAPTDRPLDVIKDPASDQLYIRQKDLAVLKKLVPRSGLHAGRRSSQTILQPH